MYKTGDFMMMRGVVEKYTGNANEVTVPEGVCEIGKSAFANCPRLKSVVLPQSLKKIGEGAFCDCKNLQNIVIPNCVTEIGTIAFKACKKLSNVQLPINLLKIEDGMFAFCDNLESIVIPEGVLIIGEWAFSHCSHLQSVQLPDSLLMIGEEGFQNCEYLKNIEIPQNVSIIGDKAFEGCQGLETAAFPSGFPCIRCGSDLDDSDKCKACGLKRDAVKEESTVFPALDTDSDNWEYSVISIAPDRKGDCVLLHAYKGLHKVVMPPETIEGIPVVGVVTDPEEAYCYIPEEKAHPYAIILPPTIHWLCCGLLWVKLNPVAVYGGQDILLFRGESELSAWRIYNAKRGTICSSLDCVTTIMNNELCFINNSGIWGRINIDGAAVDSWDATVDPYWSRHSSGLSWDQMKEDIKKMYEQQTLTYLWGSCYDYGFETTISGLTLTRNGDRIKLEATAAGVPTRELSYKDFCKGLDCDTLMLTMIALDEMGVVKPESGL